MTPRYCYCLTLSGYVGLFVLLLVWQTGFAPPARSLAVVLVLLLITLTPLLIPLKGVLKADLKSSAWLAFISLLYFIHAVAEIYSSSTLRLFAGLELFFSLTVFFGACFYVRFSGRAKK